jgi:2-keto-4-pentenoate hydratase/2-oxohepta-3-ene-1,7-dioic acid hydratase in catechol pathway/regulator of RNase E activity RraA
MEATDLRPSKIIAVHLNYRSRIAERGKAPENPSYFLKAPSTLNVSGEKVYRPPGCELLAMEAEVALVIGKECKNVGVQAAWDYVRWVTAANDYGVYDLRYADPGSNVHSKSFDTFTPIGPKFLSAQELGPDGFHLRGWINGELVQDARLDEDLAFSFPFLIADLSRVMTLHAGDIVLTGTPRGSTVVQPGDTVEVEVSHSSGASSERLTNGIVSLPGELAGTGALPRVDTATLTAAYGSSSLASPPASVLTPELKNKLESVATATLSSQMRKRGLNNVSIDGLQATRPDHRVVGLARTLRYVPNREDLFKTHGGGFNAQKRAIDSVNEGEVLVMEARGEKGTGTVGDILALRAQVRGAAAIITDGGVRDYTAVAGLDMPTYFANPHPAVLGRRHIPWDSDITIACGGATVQPGDIIVADSDGILVIPPGIAEELVDDCIEQEKEELFIFEMVKQGNSVDGLYPMNNEWQARYKEWSSITEGARSA